MNFYTINSDDLREMDYGICEDFQQEIAQFYQDIRRGMTHHQLKGYDVYTTICEDGEIFTISDDSQMPLVTGFIYLTPEESLKVKPVAHDMIQNMNKKMNELTGETKNWTIIKRWPVAPSCNIYLHLIPTLLMFTNQKTRFNGKTLDQVMFEMGTIETLIVYALLEYDKPA